MLALSEVQTILGAVEEGPYRDYLTALVFSGMRAGEASALRVEDVDLAGRVIRVRRSFSTGSDGKIVEQVPKSHKERTVPLPGALVTVLGRAMGGTGGADAGTVANDMRALLGRSSLQVTERYGRARSDAALRANSALDKLMGSKGMVRDYHEVRMERFAPLYEYLKAHAAEETVSLTFDEIEEILGLALPEIARRQNHAWWTTNPVKVRARSWQAAGRHPFPHATGVCFCRAKSLAWHSVGESRRSAERKRNYALGRLNDSSADEQLLGEVASGWWEPHLVYVIHFAEAGLYKVGLTHHATERVRDLSRVGGVVVETLNVPNRWVAAVLENDVLLAVDDARMEPPLWIAQVAGATEFWRDDVEPPLLETTLSTLGDVTRNRGTSIDRAAVPASRRKP